jgi:nucleoid-associated protein YgaU
MRAMGIGAALLALSVLIVPLGTASAQYGGQWDPQKLSRGECLSAEEYSKLSQEEAAAYCAAMQEALDSQKGKAANLRSQAERQEAEADALREQVNSLKDRLADMQRNVDKMEREYGPYRGKIFKHTVVKGEFLSKIASYGRVYGDAMKWPRLYRANRDQIQDPNLIYPDQVLKVPQGYPNWHTVMQGEYLSKIANYWEIYNDGRQWPKIYEANRDQIRDPDLIHPNQVLTIPR